MKIREILELTQSMNIAAIAKEHLTIGEKRVRAILKELGCTNQAGKKGWVYEGDRPEVLEQSIYEFAEPTKPKAVNKPTSQQSTKETKQEPIFTENKPTNKPIKQQENKPLKKVTYEIEEHLHDELKIMAVRQKRKVSDIVNELIKRGLE